MAADQSISSWFPLTPRSVQHGFRTARRSLSRALSAGPCYAKLDEKSPGERAAAEAVAKAAEKAASSYGKQQWADAIERNLGMLKQIIEHRRREHLLASMNEDTATKEALEDELKDLKVRQARLSCALWVEPDEMPSSSSLLEVEYGKLQAELEEALEKLGLVKSSTRRMTYSKCDLSPAPSPPKEFRRCEDVSLPVSPPKKAAKIEQAVVSGIIAPPQLECCSQSDPAGLSGSAPVEAVLGHHSCETAAEVVIGKVSQIGGHLSGKASPAALGSETSLQLATGAERDGAPSTPKAGGKGPAVPQAKAGKKGGKGPAPPGKGKGPPPPPSSTSAKGGKGPPAPAGKGTKVRKVTPLGRRFHWKELSAERVRGTIFDDGEEGGELVVNTSSLQSYFAEGDELCKIGGSSSSKARPESDEICIFDSGRMQNIAIVLRGLFGQMPTVQDMEQLAAGIEAVDAAAAGTAAACLQDAEKLGLLPLAMPSAEEGNELTCHAPERLRLTEQLVLPLAKVSRVTQRVRALRLAAHAGSLQSALLSRIKAVCAASEALRESLALRRFLRIVAKLGSWINSSDPDMEKGFAISSALGKLRMFRALREDKALTLLHVAILAAAGGDVKVAGNLSNSLALELECLGPVAREDLQDLGQGVTGFAEEEKWLFRESESQGSAVANYSDDVLVRMRAIHQEQLIGFSKSLSDAWIAARKELSRMLAFFAESEEGGLESAVEQLFKTLQVFQRDVAQATADILAKPARFMRAYAAGPNQSVPEGARPQQGPRPKARSRSVVLHATRPSAASSRGNAQTPTEIGAPASRIQSSMQRFSMADRVALQSSALKAESSPCAGSKESEAALSEEMPAREDKQILLKLGSRELGADDLETY